MSWHCIGILAFIIVTTSSKTAFLHNYGVYLHPLNQCCSFRPISLLMWQWSGRGEELQGPTVLAHHILAEVVAELTQML